MGYADVVCYWLVIHSMKGLILHAGIGKSLFLYFLMWRSARSGRTVIWDRQYVTPVMFSSQGVFKGPLEAFERQLQDPETWCALLHMARIKSA